MTKMNLKLTIADEVEAIEHLALPNPVLKRIRNSILKTPWTQGFLNFYELHQLHDKIIFNDDTYVDSLIFFEESFTPKLMELELLYAELARMDPFLMKREFVQALKFYFDMRVFKPLLGEAFIKRFILNCRPYGFLHQEATKKEDQDYKIDGFVRNVDICVTHAYQVKTFNTYPSWDTLEKRKKDADKCKKYFGSEPLMFFTNVAERNKNDRFIIWYDKHGFAWKIGFTNYGKMGGKADKLFAGALTAAFKEKEALRVK